MTICALWGTHQPGCERPGCPGPVSRNEDLHGQGAGWAPTPEPPPFLPGAAWFSLVLSRPSLLPLLSLDTSSGVGGPVAQRGCVTRPESHSWSGAEPGHSMPVGFISCWPPERQCGLMGKGVLSGVRVKQLSLSSVPSQPGRWTTLSAALLTVRLDTNASYQWQTLLPFPPRRSQLHYTSQAPLWDPRD